MLQVNEYQDLEKVPLENKESPMTNLSADAYL